MRLLLGSAAETVEQSAAARKADTSPSMDKHLTPASWLCVADSAACQASASSSAEHALASIAQLRLSVLGRQQGTMGQKILISGVAPANQTKERSVHELFAGAFRNKSSM